MNSVKNILTSTRQFLSKVKLLARSLHRLSKNNLGWGKNLGNLIDAYQTGGLHRVKEILVLASKDVPPDSWEAYQRTLSTEVLPRIHKHIVEHGAPVTISIIVPTYNTPEPMLREMLASVQNQVYPNWELCIADDASPLPHVRKILQEYASADPRIKLHFSTENKGVSHVSNQAIAMATGPFIVLLDHDDVLQPQAIFRAAQAVIHNDADMVYSDEMLIAGDDGRILDFVHRPAFSPEYLRGHPYIVHMVGFRTQLLKEIGGFNEDLKISQDYDLILRVSERAKKIVHLPEILYLWRVHTASAGHQLASKVMETSSAILQRHLGRLHEDGTASPGVSFNFFAARYPLQAGQRVAIIIPTKNHGDLVRQCVDSINATVKDIPFDIVVVDHASDDPGTLDYLHSIGDTATILRYQGPFNFSAINNWAIAQLPNTYSHYLLCNNDIEAIRPGWLERMMELAQNPGIGIVGAQLLYPDQTSLQHAGVCIGASDVAEHYFKFLKINPEQPDLRYVGRLALPHEVSAVTAACLLVRKDAFDAVHGLNENLAVGFGDVDFCLRVLQQGWRIVQCPPAVLIHHESYTRGKSTGNDAHPQDTAAFRTQWKELLAKGDPYYNPCMQLTHHSWHVTTPLHCTFESHRRVVERDTATGRQKIYHG